MRQTGMFNNDRLVCLMCVYPILQDACIASRLGWLLRPAQDRLFVGDPPMRHRLILTLSRYVDEAQDNLIVDMKRWFLFLINSLQNG